MLENNVASWRDTEGVDGFGSTTQQEFSELLKALTAGQDITAPAAVPGEGFPLRVEDLERTLRNTTYRMNHIKLYKGLPKTGASNTVSEYNRISDYGENIDAFIDEGDLPEVTDGTFSRQYAVQRYLGTTRSVSHVMSLVQPAHGSVLAQETINGTMYLLKQIERALFYADNALDPLQFDGFKKLITANSPAANIHDKRGEALTEDDLNDATMTVSDAPNYGQMTHLHLNPKHHADLVKTFYPAQRYDLFGKPDNGMVGLNVRGWTSPAGNVMFEPNTFISDSPLAPTAAVGAAATRPASPTISVGAATAAATGANLFGAADAGAYRYRVVARNRYGASTSVVVTGSPVTVAAGEKVTFTVAEGSPGASWYEIYRSKVGGAASTERLIKRWNRTGATDVITDENEDLPDTQIAIGFQQNLEAVSIKSLAPMVKIPLATIDSSIRWMQLCYLTPILYTPGKIFLFKNIGRDPDGF